MVVYIDGIHGSWWFVGFIVAVAKLQMFVCVPFGLVEEASTLRHLEQLPRVSSFCIHFIYITLDLDKVLVLPYIIIFQKKNEENIITKLCIKLLKKTMHKMIVFLCQNKYIYFAS